MSADFVDLTGNLQAESDRDGVLTVGTTRHHHLRAPFGKVGQRCHGPPKNP
jgi:hypothetical protein